jgi:DNA-directed RNA polymerase subunit RPC12/RpoP
MDRTLSDKDRQIVFNRDGYRCRYCGTTIPPFHVDHVYPWSHNGETSVENSAVSCQNCNSKKHSSIGMWPKPIGYFEKKSHINLPSMVLFILSIVLLYNSLDTVLNYPSFMLMGKLFGLLGVLSGLIATVVHIRGVDE